MFNNDYELCVLTMNRNQHTYTYVGFPCFSIFLLGLSIDMIFVYVHSIYNCKYVYPITLILNIIDNFLHFYIFK